MRFYLKSTISFHTYTNSSFLCPNSLAPRPTNAYSFDYEELQGEWDTQFINDLNFNDHSIGNSERWKQEYTSERQKKLRKKIKIRTMEEIKRFDQIMHNSHIY